jgi:hypothetical protein
MCQSARIDDLQTDQGCSLRFRPRLCENSAAMPLMKSSAEFSKPWASQNIEKHKKFGSARPSSMHFNLRPEFPHSLGQLRAQAVRSRLVYSWRVLAKIVWIMPIRIFQPTALYTIAQITFSVSRIYEWNYVDVMGHNFAQYGYDRLNIQFGKFANNRGLVMIRAGAVAMGTVAIMVLATPSRAEDLPRFDIALFCKQNSLSRGDPSVCLRGEETKRVALQLGWDRFPKQRKHFCVQSVTFKPRVERSYVKLASCLDDGLSS